MKEDYRTYTLAEALAERTIEYGSESSTDVLESFAEMLADGFCEGNRVKLDDTERIALEADLQSFIEDMVVPEADQLVADWNREAREEYFEIEEARRGQY